MVFSALELFLNGMCYLNPRLLTYLLTYFMAQHDSIVAACCLQSETTGCHSTDAPLQQEGKAAQAIIQRASEQRIVLFAISFSSSVLHFPGSL